MQEKLISTKLMTTRESSTRKLKTIQTNNKTLQVTLKMIAVAFQLSFMKSIFDSSIQLRTNKSSRRLTTSLLEWKILWITSQQRVSSLLDLLPIRIIVLFLKNQITLKLWYRLGSEVELKKKSRKDLRML